MDKKEEENMGDSEIGERKHGGGFLCVRVCERQRDLKWKGQLG